jgi:YD repeat-containing protein
VESGATTRYGYDAENRLTGVAGPISASYAYDGDGYRVGKTVNGVTTTYAWERLSAGGLGTVVGRCTPGHCQGTRADIEHSPSGARGRYAAASTGSTG